MIQKRIQKIIQNNKTSHVIIAFFTAMITLFSCNTIKQQPQVVSEMKQPYDSVYVESKIEMQDTAVNPIQQIDKESLYSYQWITYRAKVDYVFEGNSGTCNLYFVNKIDSIVYFNINISGIEVVRVVFTPKEVTYVNKLNKTYYQGSYFFIEKIAKVPLNFNILESIFNGKEYKGDDMETIEKILSIQYLDYIPILEKSFFSKMFLKSDDFSFQLDLKNIRFDTPGPTSITIPESFSKISFQPKL